MRIMVCRKRKIGWFETSDPYDPAIPKNIVDQIVKDIILCGVGAWVTTDGSNCVRIYPEHLPEGAEEQPNGAAF